MANILGSLVVSLLAETGAFQSGMSKAGYTARQTAKDIQGAFGRVGESIQGALSQFGPMGQAISNVGSQIEGMFASFGKGGSAMGIAIGAIGAIGAAGITAAAGLSAMAIEGAEVIERLSVISQKTGITIRDLQVFEAAGKTVGVSLEDMVTATRKFDQGLEGMGKGAGVARAVLKDLGVTSKDNTEALLQAADAFAKMADGPRKAADAVALFGRSGLDMIPLLNKGRAGILEMQKTVEEFAPTISVKAVAANEAWRKSTVSLGEAWDSFKVNMTESVLPSISSAIDKLAVLTKGTGNIISQLYKHTGQSIATLFNQGAIGAGTLASLEDIDKIPEQSATSSQAATTKAAAKAVEDLSAKQESLFELEKAGGEAAYALEKKKQDITDATTAGRFDLALAYQKQLPPLEAAVARIREQDAAWKSVGKTIADLEGGKGNFTPKRGATERGSAAFEAALKAPDIGPDNKQAVAASEATAATMEKVSEQWKAGQKSVAEFWQSYGDGGKSSAAEIDATYDDEKARWFDLLQAKEISQTQFNTVSIQLEKNRSDALTAMQTSSSGFGDQARTFFATWQSAGSEFSKSFFADMQQGIESLNNALAEMAATGKKPNFAKLGQGISKDFLSTGLKTGESALLGKFGIGGKPDGSNSKPFYVIDANIAKSVASQSKSMLSSGGGGGGLLGNLLSFLPMLAGGGDVSADHAYIVGEKHPEFFVPKTSGTVVPSLQMGGSHATNVQVHFNGVTDHDSFKRNQSQVLNGIANAVGRAGSRR